MNSFQTSVFRKSTFSGLGLQFDSSIPHHFRTNIISCLIDRAFKICSTELAFTLELKFLKEFFLANNFSINLIDKCFKKKLKILFIMEKLAMLQFPKNLLILNYLFSVPKLT